MTTTRAKFQCQSMSRHSWSDQVITYKFGAIYDQGLAAEDQGFARATPSGSLEIQVDNPNVEFELGRFYYLDLTKVEVDQ